jgi:hypothetical protein
LLQVFLRDFSAVPDEEMVNRILGWANGSSVEPPELYKHLLQQSGKLYFIQDQDFVTFLAQFYDYGQKKIVCSGRWFSCSLSPSPSYDQLVFRLACQVTFSRSSTSCCSFS